MIGYGLVNGEVRGAGVGLSRIAPRFTLMVEFRPYIDMPKERYFNKERKGYLDVIEDPRPEGGGRLIKVSGLTLRQVRRMMKRLGFEKISSLPKNNKGGTRTHRWTNASSEEREEYNQKTLQDLLQRKAQKESAIARRKDCFG